MERSMKCRCHHPANRLVLAGPAAVADLSELPHFDGRQYSEWKLKTVRQRMGNVSIDPEKLVEAVDAMGGLGAVEGKQSVKGMGWTAVAATMGIDIEKNRDAGYQIRKVFMVYHHVQRGGSGGGERSGPGSNPRCSARATHQGQA